MYLRCLRLRLSLGISYCSWRHPHSSCSRPPLTLVSSQGHLCYFWGYMHVFRLSWQWSRHLPFASSLFHLPDVPTASGVQVLLPSYRGWENGPPQLSIWPLEPGGSSAGLKPHQLFLELSDRFLAVFSPRPWGGRAGSSDRTDTLPFASFFFLFFYFFVFFRAASSAYGSSQARGRIRAAAANLHHSQILNPLSKAQDCTCILKDTSEFRDC